MARRDPLSRLHETLLARSADLCKRLAHELANLRDLRAADSTWDSADVAFETSSDERSSQLAELDARELNKIERALGRLRQRRYGICEGGGENCQHRIPVARLRALPYTTLCINCEREMEKHPARLDRRGAGNWTQVFDWEAPIERRRINLSELEMGLSGNRRG
jgi:RNA polymerase-binding transcription factor